MDGEPDQPTEQPAAEAAPAEQEQPAAASEAAPAEAPA